MGNTAEKWKTVFFSPKNAIFGFWPKNQKLTPLYYCQKIQNFRIWSRIFNTLLNGPKRGFFLAIFRPKMADFDTGPIYTTLFLSDFWWGGTATGLLGVFSFWLFLVIFCQKMLFLAPIGKVLKIRLQILKIQIFWQ